jgi:hypothetical protein
VSLLHPTRTRERIPTQTAPAPPRAPLPPSVVAPPRHARPERKRGRGWVVAGLLGLVAAAVTLGGRLMPDSDRAPGTADPGGPTPTPEARKSQGEPVLDLPKDEANSLYRQIIGNDVKAQAVADALGSTKEGVQTSGESRYFEGKGDVAGTWEANWKAPDGTTLTLFAFPTADMDVASLARVPGAHGDPARAEVAAANDELAKQGVSPVKLGPAYTPFEVPGSDGGFYDNLESFVFYGEEGGYVVQASIRDGEGRQLEDGGQRLTLLFEQMAPAQ